MNHVVVVGLGSIGRRHATNLAAMFPDARLTFVRHRPPESGVSGESGIGAGHEVRHVTNLAEALDGTVDLAVLATPSAMHIDALPALIDHGCPLLVEKPIVATVPDCDRILELLDAAPPALRLAAFNLRYLPSLQRLRGVVTSGQLGTIARATLLAGQWLPDWRPHTDYRQSYSADAGRGGGVQLDLAHEFDAARWMLGELAVEYARCGHFSDLELRADDTAIAVLGPHSGAAPVVTVALDYLSRRRVRWYEIVGDRGRAVWDIDGTLELFDADGRHMLTDHAADFDVSATYVAMIAGIAAAATGGMAGGADRDDQLQTLADGIASSRLALQVRDWGGRQ